MEIRPYLRYIAKTADLPNKRHTVAYDCRLLYVFSGRGRMETDAGEFLLRAGDLLYYPSGISYLLSSDIDEPMLFITVNFDFTDNFPNVGVLSPVYTELFDKTLEQPSHKMINTDKFNAPFVMSGAEFARGYLLRLTELYSEEGEYSAPLISSVLGSLVYEILRFEKMSKNNNKTTEAAKAYIKEHYSEPISNQSVAAALGYHPYYLGALFKRHTGKTPKNYIDDIRFARAEELLAEGSAVYEVAFSCGFKTSEHFSKRFKQRYGVAPLEWKKRRIRLV